MNALQLAKEVEQLYFEGKSFKEALNIVLKRHGMEAN